MKKFVKIEHGFSCLVFLLPAKLRKEMVDALPDAPFKPETVRQPFESQPQFCKHLFVLPVGKKLREVSASLRKPRFEAGGGLEAVALGHPIVPVGDGFVGCFVAFDG